MSIPVHAVIYSAYPRIDSKSGLKEELKHFYYLNKHIIWFCIKVTLGIHVRPVKKIFQNREKYEKENVYWNYIYPFSYFVM